MIVLLVSAAEAQSLLDLDGLDRGLREYIGGEMKMEKLFQDDNLPDVVELRRLELDGSKRHYVAVIRTYASEEAADQAWALKEMA